MVQGRKRPGRHQRRLGRRRAGPGPQNQGRAAGGQDHPPAVHHRPVNPDRAAVRIADPPPLGGFGEHLDRQAGNQHVTEFHGNLYDIYCSKCTQKVSYEDYAKGYKHECGGIIRPGEPGGSTSTTTTVPPTTVPSGGGLTGRGD